MCSPNYELMTTTGGSKPAAARKRLAPAHGLDSGEPARPAETETQDVPAKNLPPPIIRSGLPYLWAGQSEGGHGVEDSEEIAAGDVPPHPTCDVPPPPPPQPGR